MSNILIGVNGEIGSGKSTVVDYIKKKFNFLEYMFAEPLKNVAICLGFEPHQVFGTQEQKLQINEFWGISGRQFLQVFGTEVCRDYVPKVLPQMKFNGITMWIRLFEKFYEQHRRQRIAVSDVRFKDESDTIKKYDGIIIKIVRPSLNKPIDAVTQHASELQANLIKPNVILVNDGSLADLYKKLDNLVDCILAGNISASTLEVTF